ncbi:nitroreductase [Pollutimonas bauzanensis]|jgi:nitroreductase|uniref:nitroreductase family protein n=1 Tax=Pollutimonas bauzanensis TaxID=658167 RepID=UPI00334275F3
MSVTPLDYLLSRRSVKLVQSPGPDDHQLAQILQTAMSAPDHGRLQPWRFTLIREEGIARLAELSTSAIKAANLPFPPEKEASVRRWLAKVPLLIGIACQIDHSNTKIPEHERMLAVGAAATNMLNAAHMLGFGAFWSTGLGTYLDEVTEALGFDNLDYRFMGFLSIGTPIVTLDPVQRPDYQQFVTEWAG